MCEEWSGLKSGVAPGTSRVELQPLQYLVYQTECLQESRYFFLPGTVNNARNININNDMTQKCSPPPSSQRALVHGDHELQNFVLLSSPARQRTTRGWEGEKARETLDQAGTSDEILILIRHLQNGMKKALNQSFRKTATAPQGSERIEHVTAISHSKML